MAPETFSPAPELASQVCKRLHQAHRDYRLYPEDHPTVQATMDRLMEVVKAYLGKYGSLFLQVEEDRLLLQDEPVYTRSAKGTGSEDLAFLLFRDGIRGLNILEGVEPGELAGLVDCLARADGLADLDHDLVTALWEQDLMHIDCEVVDPFLGGDGISNDVFGDLKETVLSRMNELTSAGGPDAAVAGGGAGGDDSGGAADADGEGDSSSATPGTVDPETVALTAEELQASDWELAHPAVLLDDFAVVLLEIIGDPRGLSTGEDKLVDSMVMVVETYMDEGDLNGLDLVGERLSILEEQGRRPAGFGDEILGRAATPDRLAGLIAGLQSASPEKAARLERLLKRMRTCAYPTFLEILATSDDRTVRKLVLDLLRVTGGIPTEHLLPLFSDSRWYVVRNAVHLATESGDPRLVDQLERLLSHPDPRVRREAVRGIDSFGEKRSVPSLLSALVDEDSPVRILALRSLGRLGDARQFPALLNHVESRDLEAKRPEEAEAMLLTLALLGGEKAVETLNKLWKRRVFGSRPLALRLAAIQALGTVRSPEAAKALGEAVRSGESAVQRAAARALGESQARARGLG